MNGAVTEQHDCNTEIKFVDRSLHAFHWQENNIKSCNHKIQTSRAHSGRCKDLIRSLRSNTINCSLFIRINLCSAYKISFNKQDSSTYMTVVSRYRCAVNVISWRHRNAAAMRRRHRIMCRRLPDTFNWQMWKWRRLLTGDAGGCDAGLLNHAVRRCRCIWRHWWPWRHWLMTRIFIVSVLYRQIMQLIIDLFGASIMELGSP
jgi:hypothetical protein